jgi:uncharacterized protein
MKCPHCFLELIITPLYDKEVDKCPKCEGIWLDKNDSENTFDFIDEDDDKDNTTYQDFQPKENSNDENVENKLEYYYYKKPFKENEKIDNMFDFE